MFSEEENTYPYPKHNAEFSQLKSGDHTAMQLTINGYLRSATLTWKWQRELAVITVCNGDTFSIFEKQKWLLDFIMGMNHFRNLTTSLRRSNLSQISSLSIDGHLR